MNQVYTPVTNRFERLSAADVRADAAFEKHRVAGGPFLHELHPCAQYCIYELTERLAKLESDAQALADVRTLDAWAADRERDEGPSNASHTTRRPENPNRGEWVTHLFSGYEGDEDQHDFHGATPEGARAKAAEWVRKQAATPGEGLK